MSMYDPKLQSQGGAAIAAPDPSATQAVSGVLAGGLDLAADFLKRENEAKQEAAVQAMELEQEGIIESVAGKIYDIEMLGAENQTVATKRFYDERRKFLASGGTIAQWNSGVKRAKELGADFTTFVGGLRSEEKEDAEEAAKRDREQQVKLQERVGAVIANRGWLSSEGKQALNRLGELDAGTPEYEQALFNIENDIAFQKAEQERQVKRLTQGKSQAEYDSMMTQRTFSRVLSAEVREELDILRGQVDLSNPQSLQEVGQKANQLRLDISAMLSGKVPEFVDPETAAQIREGTKKLLPEDKKQLLESLDTLVDGIDTVIANQASTTAVTNVANRARANIDIQLYGITEAAMKKYANVASAVALSRMGVAISTAEEIDLMNNMTQIVEGLQNPSPPPPPPANENGGGTLEKAAKKVSLAILQPAAPIPQEAADDYTDRVMAYVSPPVTANRAREMFGPDAGWSKFLESQLQYEDNVANLAQVYERPEVQNSILRTSQEALEQYTKRLFSSYNFTAEQPSMMGAGGFAGAGDIPRVAEESPISTNMQWVTDKDGAIVFSVKNRQSVSTAALRSLKTYNDIMRNTFLFLKKLDELNGTPPDDLENSYAYKFNASQMQAASSYNVTKQ